MENALIVQPNSSQETLKFGLLAPRKLSPSRALHVRSADLQRLRPESHGVVPLQGELLAFEAKQRPSPIF